MTRLTASGVCVWCWWRWGWGRGGLCARTHVARASLQAPRVSNVILGLAACRIPQALQVPLLQNPLHKFRGPMAEAITVKPNIESNLLKEGCHVCHPAAAFARRCAALLPRQCKTRITSLLHQPVLLHQDQPPHGCCKHSSIPTKDTNRKRPNSASTTKVGVLARTPSKRLKKPL
jgi:hypothetical protein